MHTDDQLTRNTRPLLTKEEAHQKHDICERLLTGINDLKVLGVLCAGAPAPSPAIADLAAEAKDRWVKLCEQMRKELADLHALSVFAEARARAIPALLAPITAAPADGNPPRKVWPPTHGYSAAARQQRKRRSQEAASTPADALSAYGDFVPWD